MSQTDIKIRKAWNKANYDYFQLAVPKGKKAELIAYAESRGETLSGIIKRSLMKETGIDLYK